MRKTKIKVCPNCEGFGFVWIDDPDDFNEDPDIIQVTCRVCDGEGEVLHEVVTVVRPG